MIGTISTVCAITIADGVKRMPSEPSGPARGQQQIKRETHHHRRQAHHGVEHNDDDGAVPGTL